MFVTMQGTPYTLAVGPLLSPLGIPCTAPPWGKLVAVDLAQGRIAWEAPLGSVHEMGPFPLPWHIDWGTPNLGGGIGALNATDKAWASTVRVSAGSRMPSSQRRAVE